MAAKSRPEEGSLYDLMRQHAGTALFLPPAYWTDTHIELLASFEELPPCDTPVPSFIPGSPPSKGVVSPSPQIKTLSGALTEILLPCEWHSDAVRSVLKTLWPQPFSESCLKPGMHLRFGKSVYHNAVRVPIMWTFPLEQVRSSASSHTTPAQSTVDRGSEGPAGLSMLCYIGRSQLASLRQGLFTAPRSSEAPNAPVLRLQKLRSKMLIPSNLDHDAYLVGIFLAMGQRHFYGSPVSPHQPRQDFQKIRLRILTHDDDRAEFIVYTAYVTAHFLQQFHKPFSVPKGSTAESRCMKIEFTRVPIWPILGLRERLGKALGGEMVGSFDEATMETWLPGVATKPPTTGKRKRAATELAGVGPGRDSQEHKPNAEGGPVLFSDLLNNCFAIGAKGPSLEGQQSCLWGQSITCPLR